jgi:hypothetical protein
MEGEGTLEVRPGGEGPGGLVPVGDNAVALDRGAAPAGEVEASRDDDLGRGEGRLRISVAKRAVRGDEPRRLHCLERVEHRRHGLVVHLDQLERVFGGVAIAGHDDGERLAHVARDLVRRRAVGNRALDAGRERVRHLGDVGAGEDADDGWQLERRRRVEAGDSRVCVLRAEDRGVAGARRRSEIVDVAAGAA